MAAPNPTPPNVPFGAHLRDGFKTRITFGDDVGVSLWEKTVKPPGLDGGDKIEQSTMRNTLLRTYHPRSLITMTDLTMTCAYDPFIFLDILDLVNVNQVITVTFPDNSTVAFWGFLKSVEPNDHTEGEQPEVTVTICPTNVDTDYAEQNLVYTQ